MKSNWNYPTTVWVGKDRIKDLGEACHNLKINNPLFVTDKDLVTPVSYTHLTLPTKA